MEFVCSSNSKEEDFSLLIEHLCLHLTDKYYDVRFLSLHLLPAGTLSRIHTIQQLLTALLHRDVISPDDVTFLWDIMLTIECYQLAQLVQHYHMKWINTQSSHVPS